jgi:hypothetical protein
MSLEVFDAHIGTQGMEGICELWNYLAPLLMLCGPSHVLVVMVSNRVIWLLDGIHKKVPSGLNPKYSRLLCGVFLTTSLPPIFDMGDNL